MSITTTAEAIKYFELAIGDMKEAISYKIENDEEYISFKEKCYEKHGLTFLFFKYALEFGLYDGRNGHKNSVDFFKINSKGEIIFDENNTFEGIEEIAKEAQKLVSKFL